MPQDDFFSHLQSWSQRKHRLLRQYLTPFSAKVGKTSNIIYCIDCFAGRGKYEDDKPGSPLLLARLIDECAKWRKPVNLRVINVESNPENFESLSHLMQRWVAKDVVTNLPGKFGGLVPQILAQIGSAPAFFFIDPFGPTDIPFDDLLPILERNQSKTELFINFGTGGLRRIADAAMRSPSETHKQAKTIQTNMTRVTQILGGDEWLARFRAGILSTAERNQVLLQEYMHKLRSYRYSVASYPIRPSVEASLKYQLVFCTRHSDGILLMNDFFRKAEDELLRDSTVKPEQPLLSDDFDLVQQAIRSRRAELKHLILDFIQAHHETTRGIIKRHLKFQRFAEFHETDYNAVVKELVEQGVLKTSDGRKTLNDDKTLTYTL